MGVDSSPLTPPDADASAPRIWPQILGPIALVAVADGLYFAIASPSGTASAPIAPPGWVVATVWVLPFGALGRSRWLLLRAGAAGDPAATRVRRMLDLLIVVCLAYPLYAIAPGNDYVAFGANLIVLAYAAWLAGLAFRVDARRDTGAASVPEVAPVDRFTRWS